MWKAQETLHSNRNLQQYCGSIPLRWKKWNRPRYVGIVYLETQVSQTRQCHAGNDIPYIILLIPWQLHIYWKNSHSSSKHWSHWMSLWRILSQLCIQGGPIGTTHNTGQSHISKKVHQQLVQPLWILHWGALASLRILLYRVQHPLGTSRWRYDSTTKHGRLQPRRNTNQH